MSTTLQVLSLLQEYEQHMYEAGAQVHSSRWHCTQARRHASRHSLVVDDLFRASQVREDISASTFVRVEDDDDTLEMICHSRQSNQCNDKENDMPVKENSGSDGLRRRKGNVDELTHKTAMKEDHGESASNSGKAKDDPLFLFGTLPPRELWKAQSDAQQALEHYVKAAQLVIQMQKCLSTK